MALALLAITIRSTTRIRLGFDHALNTGAFLSTRYVVTNLDAKGVDPTVKAALLVGDSPQSVELVLSEELVDDALYEIACTGVPDTEPATFTGTQQFRTAAKRINPSAAVDAAELDRVLYGIDLVWDGQDIVENATGDLATVEGMENMQAAAKRNVESDGLPWDETYGSKTRRFVDAPSPSLPSMRGSIQRGLLSDDRVESVTTTLVSDDNTGNPKLDVSVKVIGDRQIALSSDVQPRSA